MFTKYGLACLLVTGVVWGSVIAGGNRPRPKSSSANQDVKTASVRELLEERALAYKELSRISGVLSHSGAPGYGQVGTDLAIVKKEIEAEIELIECENAVGLIAARLRLVQALREREQVVQATYQAGGVEGQSAPAVLTAKIARIEAELALARQKMEFAPVPLDGEVTIGDPGDLPAGTGQ